MADDPNKKKADSKRISKQPHEEAYQRRRRSGNVRDDQESNNEQESRGEERGKRDSTDQRNKER
jgi:hypothetical protein